MLLTASELTQSLHQLPGWDVVDRTLERKYTFADFVVAMQFVNDLAEAAERAGHHPDIDIRYNKVRIALSTHDAGGITEKDTALAAEAGKLSQKYQKAS